MTIDRLGKYRILEELGSGGFATVYRAEDTTLGREVALKVLDPLLMRDTTWVQRFRREARAVAALDHPHIVTIYEIAEADGRLFIAMKLIRGPDLSTALAEKGSLPWEDALAVLGDVTAALDYAHGQGMLHRDIKPGNILLDPAAGAVLTDFGFARLVNESSLSVSLSGGVVGTPEYIAPELWHNRQASPASDLYALGCVLYEMALGRKAFGGETPPAVMMAHFQPLALPEARPEGVPEGLGDVLRQALAREPGDRCRSAAELLAAAEALSVDPLTEPYAALEAALAAEEWEAAQRWAEEVRARDPAYRDIVGLSAAAQAGWARAQREAAVVQWQEQARTAVAAGRWDVAEGAVAQWLQLLPDDSEALALRDRIQAQDAAAPRRAVMTAAPTPQDVETAETRRSAQRRTGQDDADLLQQPAGSEGRSRIASWLNSVVGRLSNPAWLVAAAVVGTVVLVTALAASIMGALQSAPPSAATSTATPTRTREVDGMVQVWVPGGSFTMGSEDGSSDEKPVHQVTLDGFWIDRTEVTNAQYGECVTAGACEASGYADDSDFNDNVQPVVGVSWHDAEAYCEWAGGRLPTEAEWEYVARGPEGSLYPWGNDFACDKGNFDDETVIDDYVVPGGENCDGYERTSPVGSFPGGASWVGALDMAGNVWEWVADWYDEYPSTPQTNPTGPETGEYRVVRGGSWSLDGRLVRSAFRGRLNPTISSYYILGFRCASPQSP